MVSKYQEKLARAEAEANRRANEARKSGRSVHPEAYDSWGFRARDSFVPATRQPDPLFKPLIKRDVFDPAKYVGHTLAGFTLITESYVGSASKDRSLGTVTIPMPKSRALLQAPCFLVAEVVSAYNQNLEWRISRVVSKKSAKGNVHEDIYTLPGRYQGTVSQMADILAGWCKNVSGYPKSHDDHDKYPKAVVVTSRTQGAVPTLPPVPTGL
ncbi:MAG: hypothetical protein J0L77_02120 [Alphaproteobacteria bacterium]|nr:hypothetical protein [Alphaproteobacteria bacterium]